MTDTTSTTSYRFGHFLLHPAQRRLQRDGTPVELEAKVFDLILLLLEHRDRALSKQEAVEALWGHRPVTDTALSQLVYKARRVLDDDGDHQAVIRTVYGHGLQWVAAVETIDEAPALAQTVPASGMDATAPAPQSAAAAPPLGRRKWLLAALAVLALVATLWLVPRAKAPPGPELPRVAVLPLQNASGESALDWTEAGLPGLLSSLLARPGDLAVIDPQTVARMWHYRVPDKRDHLAHLRYVSAADIVVSGTLAKLAERMYELRVHVDPGPLHAAADIRLDGDNPAQLAVDAAPRIRRALGLDPGSALLVESARQGYMAESFARGMDLAGHGDWNAARPYFRLVADSEPSFLPARLRLGMAQANTNQIGDADRTLHDVLQRAQAAGDTSLAASALLHLANLDMQRHHFESALDNLHRGEALAQPGGSTDLQLSIALKTCVAAAALHRTDLADAALEKARALLAAQPLPDRAGDVANAELSLAEARGDSAAAERAGRAALAASQAVGNDANALIDTYNLALALQHEQRPFEALAMFASAWQRSQRVNHAQMVFGSGDNLAIGLLNSGDWQAAAAIAVRLETLGAEQKNPTWQSLALMLRAGTAWYSGDAAATLALCRQADALVSKQDPALRINLWLQMAPALLAVEPGGLHDLAARADALSAAQPGGNGLLYERELIRAIADAADGNVDAVLDALREARTAPPVYDSALDNLRSAAFAIALHDHDPRVAQAALDGFDVDNAHSADLLRLAAEWAAQTGDDKLRERAETRRDQLGKLARKALDDAGYRLADLLPDIHPATE